MMDPVTNNRIPSQPRATVVHLALLLAFSFQLFAAGSALDPPPADSIAAISPAELKMHLDFLASKEFGGRYTLSPSFNLAAKYLATRLESYGYRGAGNNGSFYQEFELTSASVEGDKSSLSVSSGNDTRQHPYGDFFNAGAGSGSAQGEVVFVGYGISAPRFHHDDYAGLDVKGKIVLIAPGVPEGIDSSRLEDEEKDDDAAFAHGAVAVFVIPAKYYADAMAAGSFRDRGSERVRLTAAPVNPLPIVRLNPALSDQLLAPAGLTIKQIHEAGTKHAALTPKATGITASVILAIKETRSTSQNVVGILLGTDSKLKDEYVTFSAHYDHLKTNEKGQVYPGADDDGSGTVSVLNIARAMALHLPKRSVFIIFHAGEELGLLGSKYNADFGHAVPLDKMAIDLNIDMIGRSKPAGDTEPRDAQLTGPNTIYAIGADRISKELHQIHVQTDEEFEKLDIDYTLNNPNHPDRIYFRSDHWNYAKHGVPIIFYFDGVHVDYHQPTDTVDKIDFIKMSRVARLAFETGWRVAQLDHKLAKTN